MLDTSQNRRQLLAVITVALLVATAGCAGILGGDGNGDENGDENGNDLPPQQNPGEDETVYSQTGSFDGERLAANHSATLRSADSFRLTYEIDHSGAYEETTTLLMELDKANNEGYQRGAIDHQDQSLTREVYTNDDTSYHRIEVDDMRPTYDKATAPYDDASFDPILNETVGQQAELESIFTQIDGIDWTQQGTDQYQGVTVTKYEADTAGIEEFLADASLTANEDQSISTVESGSATLLVTPDGTVRYFELDVSGTNPDGEQQSLTITIQYPDIGSTTVNTPDWLDEAESETSS